MVVNPPHHTALIERSTSRLLEQLDAGDVVLSRAGRNARAALIASLRAVAEAWSDVSAENVPFDRDVMARVPPADLRSFVSQSQLGWGSDRAPLVAIGTEQNYEVAADQGLGAITLDTASTIIWATGSRPDLMSRFSRAPSWADRFTPENQKSLGPYHVYTARYHQSPSSGTWQYIGRHLLEGGADWEARLGEGCYQIELKGEATRRAAYGGKPNQHRIAFLQEALSLLRETARVLIFHGCRTHIAGQALAPIFLGTGTLPPPTLHRVTDADGRQRVCHQFDADEHRVLMTWAMNGRAVGGASSYLGTVHDLIHERLPTT